jgi:hypothetical protein
MALEPEQSPSSLLGAVIHEIDARTPRKSSEPPQEVAPLFEPSELRPRSSPKMVDDVEIPRAVDVGDATILDTTYGAPEEISISIPIPEPERTPEPQVADMTEDGTYGKKKKKGGMWQLLALLFGVVTVTFVAFQTEVRNGPAKAAAAANAPTAIAVESHPEPLPVPTYRDVATPAGQGSLDLSFSQPEVVAIDGVSRDKSAHFVTNLPAGRHDVRVGEKALTVDVREGKAAVVVF